jgi:hypothetical protein
VRNWQHRASGAASYFSAEFAEKAYGFLAQLAAIAALMASFAGSDRLALIAAHPGAISSISTSRGGGSESNQSVADLFQILHSTWSREGGRIGRLDALRALHLAKTLCKPFYVFQRPVPLF